MALLSPIQVNAQSATTTTVSSSQNPVTYPQNETFTATVTSTSTVSEGTVTFQSDSSSISGCAAQAVSSGLATCTTQLAAGSHSVVAVFSGSVNFQTSTSSTLTQAVNSPVTATQQVSAAILTKGYAITTFTPVTGGGGTGSLSYGISPTLPAGLSFNTSTGAVSGTPNVPSATTIYTVTVTDSLGASASNTLSLTINGPLATQAVASTSLTVNRTFTPFAPVTGSGGTAPLIYSVSPTLPAGVGFNTFTGAISGTPTVVSAATIYTVTVTDANSATASNTFSLAVNGAVTATQTISSATLSQNHAVTAFTPVNGSGGTTPLTYSISPTLPTGLSFNTTTGAIMGTPTVASATTTYTVTVTDANSATATNTFALAVNGPVTATTAVPSSQLALNQAVASFVPVTGASGSGSLTYSVSPTLPTGLSFSTTTGAITGTPTVSSAARGYTVTVTDTLGSSATASFTLAVGVIVTSVAVTSSQNPSSFGQPVTFTATVTATGATPSGNMTFSDGGVAIGTVALSSGVAAFTTSALTTGSHTIVASYAGNATFGPSTSPALAQTVNVPADSVKLRALQLNVTKVVSQNSGQAISGAIDDAISEGFGDGGAFVTPSHSGVRFNFAADREDEPNGQTRTASGQGSSAASYAGGIAGTDSNGKSGRERQNSSRIDDAFAAIDQQMPKKAPPKTFHDEKDWLLWIDVRGSGVDRWGSSASPAGPAVTQSTLYGMQLNTLVGLTYKLRPNFLVGVLGGYETFNYAEQDINGKLTGDGWTVGSYLGWKITPTLLYDLAVTYSGIGYDGVAGTAQGNFSGERWLVSTGLTGNYKAAGFLIEPSAKVYALWEHENAYVDSLGTQQASHDFSTGRASSGAKLSHPFPSPDGVVLVPYVGVYGDYYFTQDNAAAIVAAGGVPLASTPLLQGWSARVTGGLGAKLAEGATIGFGAQYGGIGSNTRIWTATAKADVPF